MGLPINFPCKYSGNTSFRDRNILIRCFHISPRRSSLLSYSSWIDLSVHLQGCIPLFSFVSRFSVLSASRPLLRQRYCDAFLFWFVGKRCTAPICVYMHVTYRRKLTNGISVGSFFHPCRCS